MVRQHKPVFELTVESLALAISSSFLEGCVEYVKTIFVRDHVALDGEQDEIGQIHGAVLKSIELTSNEIILTW